jgi:hypothetical protein
VSVIAYRPIATVSAVGPGGAAIGSLRFTPTPATERWLADQRLCFRPFPGGFRLAGQHDLESNGGPIVPLGSEPLSFLFAIKSAEADFGARHLKAASSATAPNFFLTNRSATGTPQSTPGLSREAKIGPKDMGRIVPRRSQSRFPVRATARPKEIELHSLFGGSRIGEPIPVAVPAGAMSAGGLVDTNGQPGIAFVLRSKPPGDEQLIITDDELSTMAPIGALELVLKSFPGADPAEGRAFTATFPA